MFEIFLNDGKSQLPKDKDIYYIIAKNGIFIKKKIGIVESIVPVESISFLKEVVPRIKFHIKKIPKTIFIQVFALFEEVYRLYSSEAEINLFYNSETQEYKFIVPKQKVSQASVKYERENPFTTPWVLIGTIHSHSSFSAFHSSVDRNDEHSGGDGIHITIGNVNNRDRFSIAASLVSNGFRVKVDPLEYIDGIKVVSDVFITKPVTRIYQFVDGKLVEKVEKQKSISFTSDEKLYCFDDVKEEDFKVDESLLKNIQKQETEYYFGFDFRNSPRYTSVSSTNFGYFNNVPTIFRPLPGTQIPLFPKRDSLEDLYDDEDDDNLNPCKDCIHRDEKLEWILDNITEIENTTDEEYEKLQDNWTPDPYIREAYDVLGDFYYSANREEEDVFQDKILEFIKDKKKKTDDPKEWRKK